MLNLQYYVKCCIIFIVTISRPAGRHIPAERKNMNKEKNSFKKFFEAEKVERKKCIQKQLAEFASACNWIEAKAQEGYTFNSVYLSKKDVSNIMDTDILESHPQKILLPEVKRQVKKWGYSFNLDEIHKDHIVFEIYIRPTLWRQFNFFLLDRGLL